MEFFYFVGILIVGKLFHSNLSSRIDSLTKELASLRVKLDALKNDSRGTEGQPRNATPAPAPAPAPPSQVAIPRAPVPQKSFKDTELWKNLETQFAGNVTGIVGTLAVVLGVIFLGVYAAIQLDPLGRFGVVCLFSVTLFALYFFLNKKSFWKNLSLWIRSASGVIFLMGCIGSVGIEAMKWVSDPWLGLGLLCVGLAANLIFGFLNGGQVFASVHVLFSLLALSVVPANETTFAIAALVAFVGIIMSSKDRNWDKHIIATVLGFSLLHFYWLYSFKSNGQEFPVHPIQAIAFCLMVGAAGIVTHYRKSYESLEIQKVPLLAHVITWATLGINLYAHSKGSVWSTVFLGLSVFVSFGMSMKAGRLNIHWLYICDRLASLLLALLAVISLKKFGLSGYEISIIAAVVTTIFLRVVSQTFEKTIFRISNGILLLVYVVAGFQTLIFAGSAELNTISTLLMFVCSFLVLSFTFPYIQRKVTENNLGFSFNFEGKSHVSTFIEIPLAFHGFLALLLATRSKDSEWLIIIPFCISLWGLFLRDKLKNLLLDISVLVGTALLVLVSTMLLVGDSNSMLSDAILFAGLLALGIGGFRLSWSEYFKQKVTWPSVGIMWIAATAASYTFTKDITPILPGIIWLLISLLTGELKANEKLSKDSSKHSRTDVYVAFFGIVSIALFFIRYFFVDISNEALAFGAVRVRIFSEVFSLGTLVYWLAFSSKSRSSSIREAVDHLLEVLLVVSTIFVLYEIDSIQHPVIWSLGSFLCYFAGKKYTEFGRLILYSFWFYFGSLFHVAFLSTTIATPSILFLDQAWVMGLISILISTAFMVVAHKDRKFFAETQIALPSAVKGLAGFKNFVERLEVKVLLYPLFAAIGFFLFWSFDKTILSLLWVVECFILFLISMFMREPQFRIVSMVGIGVIFLRIVFYDLTGRDFFIKAVVFISVGAILIAMNTIYNKYKHRYDSKQQ